MYVEVVISSYCIESIRKGNIHEEYVQVNSIGVHSILVSNVFFNFRNN